MKCLEYQDEEWKQFLLSVAFCLKEKYTLGYLRCQPNTDGLTGLRVRREAMDIGPG